MKVLTIAGTSLRLMLRDRQALVFTVLLPFFIILVIGKATAGLGDDRIPVGLSVSSTGPLTSALVGSLERSHLLVFHDAPTVDDLRRGVRRGIYAAGVQVPAEYESRAGRGRRAEVVLVADIARTPFAVRAAVTAAVSRQGALLQAAGFATEHAGRSFDRNLGEAGRLERMLPAVGVRPETIGEPPKSRYIMSGYQYTAPANLVLFVFITSLAAAQITIMRRQQGITRRMLGTPTRTATVVLGETAARFSQAAFQAVYIFAVGLLVFHVDWGDPVGAFALILLFVLVGTSFGMLAASVFRNPEQAGAVGPPIGIAMGMLAGCMWPRFIMPVPMQRIGQLFPHAWAMDAFIKLIARHASFSDILPQLAVLAAFVAVLLPLATWRLRRSIVGA